MANSIWLFNNNQKITNENIIAGTDIISFTRRTRHL